MRVQLHALNNVVFSDAEWQRFLESWLDKGSDGIVEKQDECDALYQQAIDTVTKTYQELVALGVAKEQARMLLPLSIMSEVIWTCSLQAAIHFIELRNEAHAQEEIREFGEAMENLVREKFPTTWEAFKTRKE